MKNSPVINILVRTSNRPNFFNNCYESIREQDYKNIHLIVSYDDEETKKYLENYPIDVMIGFERTVCNDMQKQQFVPGYLSKPFPANEYFNEMMKYTKPGYIIYLDDDNKFTYSNALSRIISKIANENQMLFWRVKFPGYLIPNNSHFGSHPVCCQIDTGGFSFHTKYIKYAQWDNYNLGDYRTAMSLYLRIPEKTYINEIFTELQSTPGLGKREDLPTKNFQKNEI
jgi:glycosyltransferase involved in cell wall biosynthesis